MRQSITKSLYLICGGFIITACQTGQQGQVIRPNILFVISDDQSFGHTSFSGSKMVETPGFDRVAKEGIYFTNCMVASPGCAPSRSALVTGRHHWQNEQSGQHGSSWMRKHVPFVDMLEANGYHTGYTGKGVSPFQYARDENDSLWRFGNPAGKAYNSILYDIDNEPDPRFSRNISRINYFANFKHFLEDWVTGQPFYFWYGSLEPHRSYELDSWKRNGKQLEDAEVPGFLPDNETTRGDMLDYAVEIEWFDLHLSMMLDHLESIGELENTIVIVTSDNGMPFPLAKANCYEYGIHVPLAVRYPKEFPGSRIVEDLVSFIDFAPTILELTNTPSGDMLPMTGNSLVTVLKSGEEGLVDESRQYVFAGRERHSSSRWNNLGYPQRAIRSKDHLLVWNMKPERWPAGDPQRLKPGTTDELFPLYGLSEDGRHNSDHAFTDIDACPSKSFLVENHASPGVQAYFERATGKRPQFELFNIIEDPYCLNNLAYKNEHAGLLRTKLFALQQELQRSEDPRMVGPNTEIFDHYIRYMNMREFPPPYMHADY